MSRFNKFKPHFFSLCSNSAVGLAIANDQNFDQVFSSQIKDLGSAGDLLIIFTVSGNSKNLIKAAVQAKKNRMFVITFSGNNGGKLLKFSNLILKFNSKNYGVVEDLQLSMTHLISDFIVKKPNLMK